MTSPIPHNPLGLPGEKTVSVTQTFAFRDAEEAIRRAKTMRVTGALTLHISQGAVVALEFKTKVKE